MFEAYKIGVTMTLNNLVSPQLVILARQMTDLEVISKAVGKAFKSIGAESVGLVKLAKDSTASAAALDKAALGAERLERRLAQIRATAGSLGGGSGLPLLPGGGGSGSGGRGGGGGHRNGFHGGNVHMGPGGIGLGTVGMAAGDAFVPLAITAGLVYAGHSLFEAAKDLDTERARFKLFGLSASQNADAFQYVDGMRVYGATRTENMRNFREAQGVFRESGESDSRALAGAKLAAPVLSQLNFLASSLDEESAAKMKTANMAMLRYVEMSGGLSSAGAFNKLADFGWRMNTSSGGTVDWEQLRALKSTAGVAGYNLTEDALARLEPIMGELKGGGLGTALATTFGRITGGVRLPNQVAHTLVDNGIWDKSKIVWNDAGGIKRFNGNPLGTANTKLFEENPELFYEQVIRPMYKRMNLGAEDVARENLILFGRTGGKAFEAIERALPVIQQSVESMKKVKGIADSVAQAKQTLGGQGAEFDAAWTDFKTLFGTQMLPFFTGILKGGASILRAMGTHGNDTPLQAIGTFATLPWRAIGSAWDAFHGDAAGGNESPNVAGATKAPVQFLGTINMDGRKVASVVFKHGAQEAGRPQTGGSSYDPTLGMLPAGG